MIKYVVKTSEDFGSSIIRIDEDGTEWGIPQDLNNADYQAYLAYLEEQK